MLIDGQWTPAPKGRTHRARRAPATASSSAATRPATKRDAERAIAAARRAFDDGPWPRMTGAERSNILLKAADLIEARADELAYLDAHRIRQADHPGQGRDRRRRRHLALCRRPRPRPARRELQHARRRHARRRAARGDRRRLDHHAVELPVPDRQPEAALRAGRRLHRRGQAVGTDLGLDAGARRDPAEAGVPAGVVNIIVGTGAEVGAPMTSHPDVDMISGASAAAADQPSRTSTWCRFTGSTGVGRLTMANAAQTLKKVSLELGGKNPQIVFPDADLDDFVDAAVFGAYFNAGECCNAGSRLILHRDIADEVVAPHRRAVDEGQGRRSARSRRRRSARSSRRSISRRSTAMSPAPQRWRRSRRPRRRRARSRHRPVHGADHPVRRHARHGRGARGGVRPGAFGAHLRDRSTRRSASPTPSTTACRPASGAATSTPA